MVIYTEFSNQRKDMNVAFTFTSNGRCPDCGHGEFESQSNPYDMAPVKCLKCGRTTTVKRAIAAYEARQDRKDD
jgi:predicted nucleic-acid-binding Zn-ribbon protein